jgi:hypothetical protein
MKRWTGRPLLIAIIAFLACCILALAVWIPAFSQARSAGRLLAALQSVEIGRTTYDDVLRIKAEYNGTTGQERCTPDSCAIDFQIENKWIHSLHLAPRTIVWAFIGVQRGHVKGLMAKMIVGGNNPSEVTGAFIEESDLQPDLRPFSFQFSQGIGQANAHLDGAATPTQRALAFKFNIACLYKPGGCKNAGEIVPGWLAEKEKDPNFHLAPAP